MPRHAQPFWDRVDKSGDCWHWLGGRSDGYGTVRHDGRMQKAHRVAWELTNSSIPEGMAVLHRCDNPPCVNPAHLFLGTIGENNADRHRKGRSRGLFASEGRHPAKLRRGETHWSARLSDADVQEMRQQRASGTTLAEIAAAFSVHNSTVSRISNQKWRREDGNARA